MTKLGRVLLVVSLTLIFAFTAFARSADRLAEVPPAFAPNEVLVQNDPNEVLVQNRIGEVLVGDQPNEVLVLNKIGEVLVGDQPSEVLI